MKIIKKPWGQEEILETNDQYTVKRLKMNNGHKCSMQYHEFKKETIYVIKGILFIYLDGVTKTYYPNDHITILPRQIHRMEAKENDVIYLESSTSQLNDVIRLEDDYNRI